MRNHTDIKVLPAFSGDCILIKTFDQKNKEYIILIDGGTSSTFSYSLKKELKGIKQIDLIILTHIDSDHIGGLLKLLKSEVVKTIKLIELWVNHPDLISATQGSLISFNQGNHLKQLIEKNFPNLEVHSINTNSQNISRSNVEFIILSPTEEAVQNLYTQWETYNIKSSASKISAEKREYKSSLKELSKKKFHPLQKVEDDATNASSISFLLKCIDKSILLLADSRPEVIIESLEKRRFSSENQLKCDYVKISHHGSSNNTSNELLQLINCNNYIISTHGSNRHGHPSRSTIARIVYSLQRDFSKKREIFFNYDINSIEKRIGAFITEDDLKEGNWNIHHQNNF